MHGEFPRHSTQFHLKERVVNRIYLHMQAHANVIFGVGRGGDDEETNTLFAESSFYFSGNRKTILQAINGITAQSPQQRTGFISFCTLSIRPCIPGLRCWFCIRLLWEAIEPVIS